MINYAIASVFLLIAMFFDIKTKKIPNFLFIIFILFGIIYLALYSKISLYLILSLAAIFVFYFLEYLSVPEVKILTVISLFITSPISFAFFYKIIAFTLISIYAAHALIKKKIKNVSRYIFEPIFKIKISFLIDSVLFTSIFVALLFYFKVAFIYVILIFTLLPVIFSIVDKRIRSLLAAIAFFATIFLTNISIIYFLLFYLFGLGFFAFIYTLPRFFKMIIYRLTDKMPVEKLQEGMYLARTYTVLKNNSLVIKKDLFKEVVDGFNEMNFLFSSIGNTVKHFVSKKRIDYMVARELDKEKIRTLKLLSKQKKLRTAEFYLPTNKILNYLSLIIAVLIEVYGIALM